MAKKPKNDGPAGSGPASDGWTSLTLVIDCHTRELPGCHLSETSRATTASSALEQALMLDSGRWAVFRILSC